MLAAIGAGAGFSLSLGPPRYLASATFMPSAQDAGRGRIVGLAAQFGIPVSPADGAPSLGFYAEMVRSRSVVQRAIDALAGPNGRLTLDSLARLLGAPTAPESLRDMEIRRRLAKTITVELRRETGIVEVEAVLRDPTLAQAVLSEVMNQLNAFIIEMRQGRASAERRFSEQQLAAAESELRAAERRQLQFVERNRGSMSSAPALALELERIAREVDMRQQVFTSLAQAYEQARVDENRSTPLITVLEVPEHPVEQLPRRRAQWVISGIVIGLLFGFAVAFVRQFLRDEQAIVFVGATQGS